MKNVTVLQIYVKMSFQKAICMLNQKKNHKINSKIIETTHSTQKKYNTRNKNTRESSQNQMIIRDAKQNGIIQASLAEI